MTKDQKNEVIEVLKDKFSQYNNFYVTNTESLTVEQVGKLRRICFNKNVEMKVAKNTLIKKALEDASVTHIVLAGFLWMIPGYLLEMFPDRIINIHPALLPKYGGKGMYGATVHKAVKAARDKETGITIHLVNEQYDEGRILFQARCPITEELSPDDIANCVHKLEHEHYPKVIEEWILKSVDNGK